MDWRKLNPVFSLLVKKVREVRKRSRDFKVNKEALVCKVKDLEIEKAERKDKIQKEIEEFKKRQAEELERKERSLNQSLGDFDQRIAVIKGEIEERSKPLDWRENEWKKIRTYARISGGGKAAIRKAFEIVRRQEKQSTRE